MAQTHHLVLGPMPRGAGPDTHWAAGPWCFDNEEDFFPGWEDSFVFGREPLRDPATLDRAVLMAQSLTADVIPALGRHLRQLQRQRALEDNPAASLLDATSDALPGVYWETLLAPWACTVARQLVERWLRVQAMVEDWGHLPLHVELLPGDCRLNFVTEHDFIMHGALGADWNTWIMSRLLEAVWPEKWTRSYALPVTATYGQPVLPEDSDTLRHRLRAWLRSCALRLPCPPLRGMRLRQALRYSLALLHPSRQPDASRPLASHFSSAATGVRHDLPLDPLPFFMGALPQSLSELDHPVHIPPARRPRVRVASVRAHEDTAYRQRLAVWRARGNRVMFVQHGGNVGQVRCLCETPLVEFSQHAFGTWGWTSYEATGAGTGGRFLPLPYPLLDRMADQWRGGDDVLLFVGAEMPLYGHRLDSRPTPLQWLQYREDKQWFLEDLPRRLHEKIRYRPHFDAPGTLDDAPWLLPRFPRVRLCSGPLEAQMLTCALMVVDHHGTTLLQALAANVPTIAYWDREIWPMTDAAFARLDILAGAGIWQPSAEAAAAKVREIWDDPARWWQDESVQAARRAFCREHALVDPKGPDGPIIALLQRL